MVFITAFLFLQLFYTCWWKKEFSLVLRWQEQWRPSSPTLLTWPSYDIRFPISYGNFSPFNFYHEVHLLCRLREVTVLAPMHGFSVCGILYPRCIGIRAGVVCTGALGLEVDYRTVISYSVPPCPFLPAALVIVFCLYPLVYLFLSPIISNFPS